MQASELPNPGIDHQQLRRQVALSISKLQVAKSNTGRVPGGAAALVDFFTEALALAVEVNTPAEEPDPKA